MKKNQDIVEAQCGCKIDWQDYNNPIYVSYCEKHKKPYICICKKPLNRTIRRRSGVMYICVDCGREYGISSKETVMQSRLPNPILSKFENDLQAENT